MQQRTETEKKRKGGAENEWDLRSRVKIETKERWGGCCTEPIMDRRQKKSHKSLRNAAGNTWCHIIDRVNQLT